MLWEAKLPQSCSGLWQAGWFNKAIISVLEHVFSVVQHKLGSLISVRVQVWKMGGEGEKKTGFLCNMNRFPFSGFSPA